MNDPRFTVPPGMDGALPGKTSRLRRAPSSSRGRVSNAAAASQCSTNPSCVKLGMQWSLSKRAVSSFLSSRSIPPERSAARSMSRHVSCFPHRLDATASASTATALALAMSSLSSSACAAARSLAIKRAFSTSLCGYAVGSSIAPQTAPMASSFSRADDGPTEFRYGVSRPVALASTLTSLNALSSAFIVAPGMRLYSVFTTCVLACRTTSFVSPSFFTSVGTTTGTTVLASAPTFSSSAVHICSVVRDILKFGSARSRFRNPTNACNDGSAARPPVREVEHEAMEGLYRVRADLPVPQVLQRADRLARDEPELDLRGHDRRPRARRGSSRAGGPFGRLPLGRQILFLRSRRGQLAPRSRI